MARLVRNSAPDHRARSVGSVSGLDERRRVDPEGQRKS